MAESRDDGSIAPRRGLGGPILPPPPSNLAADARKAEAEAEARKADADKAEAQRAESEKQAARKTAQTEKAQQKEQAKLAKAEQARSEKESATQERRTRPPREPKRPRPDKASAGAAKKGAPRTRRAQLRLVQIDAWSVMKTAFLLSIALGIVLVVAVAIIWAVLGQAGVWESINSIVQQAVGGESGEPFDIEEYAGTSRVLGFTMIVAVFDVIFVTAIATLGAFLYNLSAALLGGIEVTLAEDN